MDAWTDPLTLERVTSPFAPAVRTATLPWHAAIAMFPAADMSAPDEYRPPTVTDESSPVESISTLAPLMSLACTCIERPSPSSWLIGILGSAISTLREHGQQQLLYRTSRKLQPSARGIVVYAENVQLLELYDL